MVERVRLESQLPDLGGRPSKYRAVYSKTCAFMAQRGATIAEMADACGVNTRTFHKWMHEYPNLRDAVDAGNDVFNPRVERALAERALGYSVDVEECFVIDGEVQKVTVR